MHSLLKFTLLGACAAAGVGVAVSLAMNPPVDETRVPALAERWLPQAETQKPTPVAKPQPEVENSLRPKPAAQELVPMPPAPAPYQPPVAANTNALELALERLHNATLRNGDVVLTALQNMQERQERAAAQLPAPTPPPPAAHPPGPAIRMSDPLDTPVEQEPAEELPPSRAVTQVRAGEGDNTLTLTLQNSDIRVVLQDISAQAGINILASKNVSGTISAVLTNVDVFTALDVILKAAGYVARREGNFVFVGLPADLQDMDRAQDQIATRIYRPNYVRSAELEQLIAPLLSQGVGKISVSSPSEIDIPPDTVKTGGDSFAGTDVVIVRDYELVLRQVDQLVADVDIKPQQVAIEAMILSVKLDDENRFGVDFQLFRDQNNVRLVSGSPLANLAQFNLNGEGLRFGFLDASTALFINALETIGETNVVASPRVLCLNKQRAEILIGAQLGYVSTTVTENAATQAIEFLEVGTQLRIRPHIYSDGQIRLEVHPELSTGTVKVIDNFTLPDKEVTQVTTNVMCQDGGTVIIGGLIREDLTNNTAQIPVLGSLPYLGPAFRNKTEKKQRNEIIVLITPRLVAEPALSIEGRQAQKEYAIRQANYLDKMSPISKRHYGRHYLRLAYAARNAGDMRTALRYANLSVHFDPQSLEASNLRAEVAGTQPEYDNNLHNYLKDGLRPWQRPVRDYTKHGYPWSPGIPPIEPDMVDSYNDPGIPGTHTTLQDSPPPLRKIKP